MSLNKFPSLVSQTHCRSDFDLLQMSHGFVLNINVMNIDICVDESVGLVADQASNPRKDPGTREMTRT